MRDLVRRLARSERGAALLEFAMASMVFFIVTLGTVEFGIAVWQYNLVSDLAQEGARWASVHGSSSASPASSADVQTFVTGRALGLAVTVTTTPAPSTLSPGGTVTVQVAHSFTTMTPLIPSGTLLLRNTAKMVMSR